MDAPEVVKFTSAREFRYRIVLAILSGKTIRISKIRYDHTNNPGLTDFEANFLKLIDLMDFLTKKIENFL